MRPSVIDPGQTKNASTVDASAWPRILLESFTSHHQMAPLDVFTRLKALYSKDERESTLHWLAGFGPETPPRIAQLLPYQRLGLAAQNVCELLG